MGELMSEVTLQPESSATPTPASAPATSLAPADGAAAVSAVDEGQAAKSQPPQTSEKPAAKPKGVSQAQWDARERLYSQERDEIAKERDSLKAELEKARSAAPTVEARDDIDDLLDDLDGTKTAKQMKSALDRLDRLEKENAQLRGVTQASRAEYWKGHYERQIEAIEGEYPDINMQELMAELSELQERDPAKYAKTDWFEHAKKMNEREEAAFTRRTERRKDELLKAWGFSGQNAPAGAEAKAQAQAVAESGGTPGKVADKFAPRPGGATKAPAKAPSSEEDGASLMARIRRENRAKFAN